MDRTQVLVVVEDASVASRTVPRVRGVRGPRPSTPPVPNAGARQKAWTVLLTGVNLPEAFATSPGGEASPRPKVPWAPTCVRVAAEAGCVVGVVALPGVEPEDVLHGALVRFWPTVLLHPPSWREDLLREVGEPITQKPLDPLLLRTATLGATRWLAARRGWDLLLIALPSAEGGGDPARALEALVPFLPPVETAILLALSGATSDVAYVATHGASGRVRTVDVAPSVLSLLGVPIPGHMEGMVHEGLVGASRLEERPPVRVPAYDRPAPGPGLSDEDHARIEAHLRALGYVG